MLGEKLMEEFWPERLKNFDAEDPDVRAYLDETDHGELCEAESDLYDAGECLQDFAESCAEAIE